MFWRNFVFSALPSALRKMSPPTPNYGKTMFQLWFNDDPTMFQLWFNYDVISAGHRNYVSTMVKLWLNYVSTIGLPKHAPNESQLCFNYGSTMVQLCFNHVSTMVQLWFDYEPQEAIVSTPVWCPALVGAVFRLGNLSREFEGVIFVKETYPRRHWD